MTQKSLLLDCVRAPPSHSTTHGNARVYIMKSLIKIKDFDDKMGKCIQIKHLENLKIDHANTYNIYIIILTHTPTCAHGSQSKLFGLRILQMERNQINISTRLRCWHQSLLGSGPVSFVSLILCAHHHLRDKDPRNNKANRGKREKAQIRKKKSGQKSERF